jgi:hypothetical protein
LECPAAHRLISRKAISFGTNAVGNQASLLVKISYLIMDSRMAMTALRIRDKKLPQILGYFFHAD